LYFIRENDLGKVLNKEMEFYQKGFQHLIVFRRGWGHFVEFHFIEKWFDLIALLKKSVLKGILLKNGLIYWF
jgi:hypothetical protein